MFERKWVSGTDELMQQQKSDTLLNSSIPHWEVNH